MSDNLLWLSASPSLQRLNQPLLHYLSQQVTVSQWEYYQTLDEGSSLTTAVTLLHEHLQHQAHPIHLAGHGISGVVGLLYSRLYPERVKSLALLSIAAQPAMTWHAHYYTQQRLLPCSRSQLLAQTALILFGKRLPLPLKDLLIALDRDLDLSPCPHSLLKLSELPKGGVSMPLLVYRSQTDSIIDPQGHSNWLPWMKYEDQLWDCPEGRHFFHYFYPELVGARLLDFWHTANSRSLHLSLTT
ncbi:MAG: alpha/beta hydrolase [Leptolyngbyaceae cyanobacterium CSU_1_3]|nr:alpha/beta hydrolase [Leptolyngbyaceae cyanobacterium CSU_1_3]